MAARPSGNLELVDRAVPGVRHDEPYRRVPVARGPGRRRRAPHVRHPGRAQHRDLRRAGEVREHHAGAGGPRRRRRLHGGCREPDRHESRDAGDRAGGGRHARGERYRRGVPRRHPDAGDRRRHPARYRPSLPAARRGPACAARADHQGTVARRTSRGCDPDHPRGGARRDQWRARSGLRRDSREPADHDGRRGVTSGLAGSRRTRSALHGRGDRGGCAAARRGRASRHLRRLGRRRCDP